MPHEAEPLHRLLAEIGLRAGGPFGFALAGGHAVAAHGIIDRPSEDVDPFADWQRRADFPIAVDAVITRGRYTPEQLCTLASEADAGFDRQFFAQMLGMIGRFDDQDFIDYGLESAQVAAMREHFRAWQAELQSSPS